MKVKELITELQKCDPEREIVLSTDEEGNYFDYLYSINELNYNPLEHTVHIEELTPELKEEGYTEEDFGDLSMCVKSIVLYP